MATSSPEFKYIELKYSIDINAKYIDTVQRIIFELPDLSYETRQLLMPVLSTQIKYLYAEKKRLTSELKNWENRK
jgi:hypothetical protein